MIVKLQKHLIYGNQKELDAFFLLAQKAGFIEFIDDSRKKAIELPEEAKGFLRAIKIAKRHPIHFKETLRFDQNPSKIADLLVLTDQTHERLLEEKRMLLAEIARVFVFGNFSLKELETIEKEGKRVFQFFCVKSSLAKEMKIPQEMIFVGAEYDLDYFVAINKEPKRYAKMVEMHIERPAGELKIRLLQVESELLKEEASIRHYSQALPLFEEALTDCLNDYHLKLAKQNASSNLSETLFATEAWVPENRVKNLYGLLSHLHVHSERIAVETHDKIPTCMQNKGTSKIGEDLVEVYDIPSHQDKDPSLWVLSFFALFFAMIISDAGYGLIYLLLGFTLKWKFPHLKGVGKRFVNLILICSTACIIWGVGTASYFGLEISPNSKFQKSSILYYLAQKKAEYHLEKKDDVLKEYEEEFPGISQVEGPKEFLNYAVKVNGKKTQYKAFEDFSDNFLMEFSFIIGILHISLSFLRYLLRNFAGFGWVVFMIGGYLYFPTFLNATTLLNFLGLVSKPVAKEVGLYLVYSGIGLAFIGAFIQTRWRAFQEILNVIQVFADVLSYLRLYALALGGMVMARVFNDTLGIEVGFFSSALLILSGHLTNISICVMGGVIHGLRLNFLEWYHYCFEGGGRLFNPLKLKRTK